MDGDQGYGFVLTERAFTLPRRTWFDVGYKVSGLGMKDFLVLEWNPFAKMFFREHV